MRDAHQQALLDAAARLGLGAEDLLPAWGIDAVRYHLGERELISIDGRINVGLSHTQVQLCLSKPATRAILQELGLPVPTGLLLPGASPAALAALVAAGPVVCKPPDGEWGTDVVMGLVTVAAVLDHAARLGGSALVQEQVQGQDLRLQALGGRLHVACVREPASVVGDGEQPLAALIAARAREVAALNPDNRLEIDAETTGLLAAQGLDLSDVPEVGRTVVLKRVSNLSKGGRAIDVSEELHPVYREWVAAIGARLGLDFFAVDVVTTDPTADPTADPAPAGARILEINAPCQWLAHTFSERRSHDLAAQILRHLFPALRQGAPS